MSVNPYECGRHPHPPAPIPIPPKVPPKHTQIEPRCLTCSHFEMCVYKKDYLKTATLIQNSLGAPALNLEVTQSYFKIPGFDGFAMPLWDKYVPKTVVFDNASDGKFFSAKFNGINTVNLVYTSERYFILIKLRY